MTHKYSVLKNVLVLAAALLIIIAGMGFTVRHEQNSTPAVTGSLSLQSASKPSSVPYEPLPDLVPGGMHVTLKEWGFCIINTSLGVRVSFSNNGEADAGPFEVKVNEVTQTFSGLKKGESASLWFSGYSNPSIAVVDSSNTVVESDESNNQLSQYLPIPTLPPVPVCYKNYLPVEKKD
jgi:hypothetical protein